jgi:hypothetical protein
MDLEKWSEGEVLGKHTPRHDTEEYESGDFTGHLTIYILKIYICRSRPILNCYTFHHTSAAYLIQYPYLLYLVWYVVVFPLYSLHAAGEAN